MPEQIQHEMLEFANIGTANYTHYRYRVQLSKAISESKLRILTDSIISQAKLKNADEVTILYYLPNSSPNEQYTAGIAKWSNQKGLSLNIGNYLENLKTNFNSKVSLSTKKEIFQYIAQNQNDSNDDDLAYRLAANNFKITESEAREIAIEGVYQGWPERKL